MSFQTRSYLCLLIPRDIRMSDGMNMRVLHVMPHILRTTYNYSIFKKNYIKRPRDFFIALSSSVAGGKF